MFSLGPDIAVVLVERALLVVCAVWVLLGMAGATFAPGTPRRYRTAAVRAASFGRLVLGAVPPLLLVGGLELVRRTSCAGAAADIASHLALPAVVVGLLMVVASILVTAVVSAKRDIEPEPRRF